MVRRWFFSNWIPIAFCCWGLLHLIFFVGAGFTIYLSPWFRWIALVSGIVLVGLALVWPFLPCCHTHEEHGHSHSHPSEIKSLFRFIVIIFPVLLCLWVKPSEFSVTTLQNRGISSELLPGMETLSTEELFSEPNNDFPFDEGNLSEISLSDLLFIAEDPELREKFLGKTIKVVGQPIFSSSTQFQLTRLFIMCCAADARPVGFWVDSLEEVSSTLQKANWLKVEGKLEFQSESERFIPRLKLISVEKTEAPEEIFLY